MRSIISYSSTQFYFQNQDGMHLFIFRAILQEVDVSQAMFMAACLRGSVEPSRFTQRGARETAISNARSPAEQLECFTTHKSPSLWPAAPTETRPTHGGFAGTPDFQGDARARPGTSLAPALSWRNKYLRGCIFSVSRIQKRTLILHSNCQSLFIAL